MRARLLTLPAALLLAVPLAACSEDDSPSNANDPNANSDVETTQCTYPEAGPPAKEVEPPPEEAVAEGEIAATMTTSIGDFEFTLDAAAAPCTVHSFVSLVERGWFDDTQCHRLSLPISILQCGDPTGTGSGGPGYSFDDELTGDETYTAGTLAMANGGVNTNGSQFFIVYGDAGLEPDYTVFGTVDDATVEAVAEAAAAGTNDQNNPGDGAPLTEIVIESATVE